jgi:hypothetical protein
MRLSRRKEVVWHLHILPAALEIPGRCPAYGLAGTVSPPGYLGIPDPGGPGTSGAQEVVWPSGQVIAQNRDAPRIGVHGAGSAACRSTMHAWSAGVDAAAEAVWPLTGATWRV